MPGRPRVYLCPNPRCRSTRLVPVGRDRMNKSPTHKGRPQLVLKCKSCGQMVGETTLERAWRRRALNR